MGINNNYHTNRLIKLCVVLLDFMALNALLYFTLPHIGSSESWSFEKMRTFWLVNNLALLIAEYRFSTIIHERLVGADAIFKRILLLASTQSLSAYLMFRIIHFTSRLGWQLLYVGIGLLVFLIIIRFIERWVLKRLRVLGYNTRTVTFVGSGKELLALSKRFMADPTRGYKISNYYGELTELQPSGSVEDFIALLDRPDELKIGEELYLNISNSQREVIKRVSRLCDQLVVKFYYVPLQDEMLNLQPLFVDDIEVQTAYVSPLEESLNSFLKRSLDVFISLIALAVTALLMPFIYVIVKIQSPGPLFFSQQRTGLDGRTFRMYKFRSMHVNADSDRLQATKDDPRKYPFGNLMRKTNIDELPQFWNVLRGDMSVVGPRPHMLAHTEQYSRLIEKYMVRHFLKPGITGWAQVTGFRGETNELWQMEGRVERDIWYMQHWTIWLDLRIIWMTFRSIFIRDKNAY